VDGEIDRVDSAMFRNEIERALAYFSILPSIVIVYIGWFDPSLTFKLILSGKFGSPTVLPRANNTNGNDIAATRPIKHPPPMKYFLDGFILIPLGFGYSFSTHLEH